MPRNDYSHVTARMHRGLAEQVSFRTPLTSRSAFRFRCNCTVYVVSVSSSGTVVGRPWWSARLILGTEVWLHRW